MTIWHLSIKRLDRAPIHDWRDLQEIKNMLTTPLTEAFELYPSTERVVDTSNQFHLYALIRNGEDCAPTIPVGWTSGMILEPDTADGAFKDSKARQRPGGRR